MRIGLWLVALYASLCLLALTPILLNGFDEWTGIPVFLLGLPWGYLLSELVETKILAVNLGLLAVSLAINAAILWLLGRAFSRWRQR
jgi:hypothetical protein